MHKDYQTILAFSIFANVKWLLFLLVLICTFFSLQAQRTDTSYSNAIQFRGYDDSVYLQENPSLSLLADTFYKAIIHKKKEYILNNTPTWDAYQQFLDSTAKQKYSETTFRYKFLLFKSGLNRQFKRINKDAKESEINFKRSEPIQFFLEHGTHPDYDREFCYLNLEMKRGKKDKIRLRILLLKMDEKWYFADDLSLIIITPK